MILDHAGVRLPLHRFHPDVIREVRRQLQTSGPLPKRASKEETLAMLQRLGDDCFHVRTAAFDELLNDLGHYREMLDLPPKGHSFEVSTRLKNARAVFYKSILPEERFVKQMGLLGSEEYLRLVKERERRNHR